MASFFTYDFLPSALAKITHYQDHIQHKTICGKKQIGEQKRISIPKKAVLTPYETNLVLFSADISAVSLVKASTPGEVQVVAHEIGFPLVMKTASEKITHKTEVKGVRINIQNEKEALDDNNMSKFNCYLNKLVELVALLKPRRAWTFD